MQGFANIHALRSHYSHAIVTARRPTQERHASHRRRCFFLSTNNMRNFVDVIFAKILFYILKRCDAMHSFILFDYTPISASFSLTLVYCSVVAQK